MMLLADLPYELLVSVFEYALLERHIFEYDPETAGLYIPFAQQTGEHDMTRINMLFALSGVCRRWRHILNASGYLCQDLTIGPRGKVVNLIHSLDPRAQLVRRVVLPFQSTATTSPQALPSLLVLEQLRHSILSLFRPRALYPLAIPFEFETNCPEFPSLKRLVWFHCANAAVAGGINSLGELVGNCPNLEYLFIGGVRGVGESTLQRHAISLPRLRVLRLNVINAYVLHAILRWDLPSLETLVLDSPEVGIPTSSSSALVPLWDRWGHQLKTVQFGRHMRFLLADHINEALNRSALVHLNCYAFFGPPLRPSVQASGLRTVSFHCEINHSLDDLPDALIVHLFERIVGYLDQNAFPLLETISLVGPNATRFRNDPCIETLVVRAQEIGIMFYVS